MCRPIVPHLISLGLPDEPEDPGRGDKEEDEDDDDREELREEDQDGRGDEDRPDETPAPRAR